ncbi:MAG: hypothetical protein AAGI09_10455, partial [Pseudomonadota bacterium]
MLEISRIRPLSESQDTDFVISQAGGRRAYEDSDSKTTKNADYVLWSGAIDFCSVAWFTTQKRAVNMSDLFWLTDAQMARLEPFFPKSHG